MTPRYVTMHMLSGDFPAIVTRENQDGSLNLTVFGPGDIYYRTDVREYVPEADDEDNDKIGQWSN